MHSQSGPFFASVFARTTGALLMHSQSGPPTFAFLLMHSQSGPFFASVFARTTGALLMHSQSGPPTFAFLLMHSQSGPFLAARLRRIAPSQVTRSTGSRTRSIAPAANALLLLSP